MTLEGKNRLKSSKKRVGLDCWSVSQQVCVCERTDERGWTCVYVCPRATAALLAQSSLHATEWFCSFHLRAEHTHSSLPLATALTNQSRVPPSSPPSVLPLLARPQRAQPLARAADLFHMNSARQRRRLRAAPSSNKEINN